MSFHAGRPIRFELYSLAFAGLIVVVIAYDRLATHDRMFRELVKKSEMPQVVQENNNNHSTTVVVESDRMVDIIERIKKTGSQNVNGSTIPSDSNTTADHASNVQRVPAIGDASHNSK